MSSNVGLSTPRGSGTSGYVQRNVSLLKPRDQEQGRPPGYSDKGPDTFKHRQPDRKILEHDRRREIEVRVLEERDRLEEENEKVEEDGNGTADADEDADAVGEERDGGGDVGKEDEGKKPDDDKSSTRKGAKRKEKKVKLSEDEIEERLEALRSRLTRELEDELAGRPPPPTGPGGADGYGKRKQDVGPGGRDAGPKARKQFKSYQVHERAEAKIEESERLRKALGIKAEGEEFHRDDPRRSNLGGERYRDRDDPRDKGWREGDKR